MRSVLIVDDHALFRSRARQLLERDGFRVVGEAGDGDSALNAARALRPQVVLLDVQLPGEDGFAVCHRILAEGEGMAVVLTSGRPEASFRRRLANSRAIGFIAKADLTPGALAAVLEAD